MANGVEPRETAVHPSPPPGIVASIFFVLFIGSIAVNFIVTGGAPYPNPYSPLEQLQDYYRRFPEALRVAGFILFGSSIPLGIYVATMVSRLQWHGIRVAGVHIALFGGLAASFFLGVSALAAWGLSQPGIATNMGGMRALQLLAFSAGGFGHTVTLGVFLAGLSVPSLVFGLLPRWLAWSGLVIAGIAILSVFSMISEGLSLLIPIGRFLGYIWMIVAGFSMPAERTTSPAVQQAIEIPMTAHH